jgi:DNA-binding response OmpR family regulator
MTSPLRILIVEDEVTIALFIEDMVIELGHQVAGLAMRLAPALELARTAALDFAILDVNLAGSLSFPVAEALEARGVPFAFATGYGSSRVDPRFAAYPVIIKPFDIATLSGILPSSA